MAFPLKVIKRYKNIPVDRGKCVTLPCDLCNADEVKLITVSNGFNLVQCKKCGFVYINPGPPQELLRDFSPKTMMMFLEKTNFNDIEIFITRPRRLPDCGSRMALSSLTFIGKALYKLTKGKFIFPWVGAFMSLARKH